VEAALAEGHNVVARCWLVERPSPVPSPGGFVAKGLKQLFPSPRWDSGALVPNAYLHAIAEISCYRAAIRLAIATILNPDLHLDETG
jgi:hypothetical protein